MDRRRHDPRISISIINNIIAIIVVITAITTCVGAIVTVGH